MNRPFRPRLRRLVPVALIALVAVGLAACGGSSLADDPQAVLAEATLPPPGPNASTLKATFTPGDANPDADGGALGGLLGGPISIEASTEGDAEEGVVGDAKVTAGPLNIALAFRADRENAWIQVGEQWYALGQPLGIDFAGLGEAVGPLDEVVIDPKASAVEEIDGVDCDRIDGRFNPAPGLTASLQEAIGGLGVPLDLEGAVDQQARISVWVSRDDGVVRRILIETDGGADQAAGGNVSVELTVVPAEAVAVTPPEDAKPITDLLLSLLGDQLGGLGDQLGGLGDLLGEGGGILPLDQLQGALTGQSA